MEIKAWVFDRIKLSFSIFFSNFINLFLPLFLYKFLFIVLIWTFFLSIFFSQFLASGINWLDFFSFLNSSFIVFSILFLMIFFIVYLTLYIWIFIWIIRTAKQIVEEREVNVIENLKYWFSKIFSAFKTYWFIFAYVALIPALIFIVWWLLLNIWLFNSSLSFLSALGWLVMWIWWLIFIVFSIYRWLKASFSLSSAIDSDSYTKDNFNFSIWLTDNKFLRILWNYILFAIIVWLIWFIYWIISLFLNISWVNFDSINTLNDFYLLAWEFSFTTQVISWFISSILNTSLTVIWIIFTYIFFLRLKKEAEAK